jgi:hypothetical protein
MNSHKIDSNGNYLPYRGFSVICNTTNVPEIKFSILGIANLPASSYHITLFNIISGNEIEISKELFRKLILSIVDITKEELSFRKKGVVIHGSTITVITEPQQTLFVNCICQNLRKILGIGSSPCVFHLTLGYIYQKQQEVQQQVFSDIYNQIPEIIKTRSPILCYFPNMTEYIPLELSSRFEQMIKNKA